MWQREPCSQTAEQAQYVRTREPIYILIQLDRGHGAFDGYFAAFAGSVSGTAF
jgi:hypothetical protein